MYNEMYGNHNWVDRILDVMYNVSEEEDDSTKNYETFGHFNKWELRDVFIQNYSENGKYREIDDDIEMNAYSDENEDSEDTTYDSFNEETFSDISCFDYYSLCLNFTYACVDKYLEEMYNAEFYNEMYERIVDSNNLDTFGYDVFSPIYDIV